MQLTCPKCQASMRQYERSGVTIDQCTECRGVFLDRGELERLSDAENAWHAQPAAPPAPAPPAAPAPPQPYPGYQVQTGYQQQQHHYPQSHGHHYKKKRKSFLDELFD